jgi:hypothetical protein
MDPAAHGDAHDNVRYSSFKQWMRDQCQRRMYNHHIKHKLQYSDEKCSSVESSVFFKSTGIPLSNF